MAFGSWAAIRCVIQEPDKLRNPPCQPRCSDDIRSHNLNPEIVFRSMAGMDALRRSPQTMRSPFLKFQHGQVLSAVPAVFIAIAIGSAGVATARDGGVFDPPAAYRTIRFAEHGGGPMQHYTASKLETSEVLHEGPDLKVVFTTSLPPSNATRTVVAGLFVLRKQGDEWVITDQKRFEAAGRESGAKAATTHSERSAPHVTVTLSQGGREAFYSHSVSYLVDDGTLRLDIPREKPVGGQVDEPGR